MSNLLQQYRLITVVGLLLIPICLLGWLFHAQSKKDIAFVERELAGTAYLLDVVPLLANSSDKDLRSRQDNIVKLQELRLQYGDLFDVSGISLTLESQLGKPQQDFAVVSKLTRALITRVGDNSNLILDPDIDSYYLMDASVLRVPDILQIIYQIEDSQKQTPNVHGNAQAKAQLMVLGSQLQSQISSIGSATEKSFIANEDGSLRQNLQMQRDVFLLQTGAATNEIMLSAQNAIPAVKTETLRNINVSTMKFWRSCTEQLLVLLTNRLEKLKLSRLFAMGLSLVITIVALSFAVSVLRQLLSRLDEKILFLAHHDPMTRLKNRTAFNEACSAILREADQTGEKVALHVLDVDRFKTINDTHGHPVGDELLKICSERLLANCRMQDIIGRFGGDEFVILQRNLSDKNNAQDFANRIVTAMRAPIVAKDSVIRTSLSCGFAQSPLHASTAESLLVYADMALYAAKSAGRNCAIGFNRELNNDVKRRHYIESTVRNGLAEDRFRLHFQPQFSADGQTLNGFEALLRLQSENKEDISPVEFIPVAEQLGLIAEIGSWVLHEGCKIAAVWPSTIHLAVNLSPLQISNGDLIATILSALTKANLAPQRLQVEITEGILLEDSKMVMEVLQSIRALGVSIAMDDFGTGYSSLAYLWRFRFDKIKIDRSFMHALENDEEHAKNILRSIVTLGHSLEMTVTAEGIETSDQATLMSHLKFDEIQGFYYGRPVPQEDLAAVILKAFRSNEVKQNAIAPITDSKTA